MAAGTTIDGGYPLAFREARFAFGRALAARGPDGSVYLYGRPTPDSPPAAWRQTPSGDRQWLATDVPHQNVGTEALRRMAGVAAREEAVVAMDWPVWQRDGTARELRVPVRVRRDAEGVHFEPVAHGAEPFMVRARSLDAFLSGRQPARLPGSAVDSGRAAARMLAAMREVPGLLGPGERVRAGAGMVLHANDLSERDPARKLLRRCLDRFSDAVAPMLDLHGPNRRILTLAAQALEPLAKAHPGLLGTQGRAWLAGEASPALAMLEGRLRAREVEPAFDEGIEVRAPAFA